MKHRKDYAFEDGLEKQLADHIETKYSKREVSQDNGRLARKEVD